MFDVDMSSDSVCLYCAFEKKKKKKSWQLVFLRGCLMKFPSVTF